MNQPFDGRDWAKHQRTHKNQKREMDEGQSKRYDFSDVMKRMCRRNDREFLALHSVLQPSSDTKDIWVKASATISALGDLVVEQQEEIDGIQATLQGVMEELVDLRHVANGVASEEMARKGRVQLETSREKAESQAIDIADSESLCWRSDLGN